MYTIIDVPKDVLIKLDEEIKKASISCNSYLAGNIKKQFAIPNAKKHLISFLASVIDKNRQEFKTYDDAIELLIDRENQLELTELWVNFQKKYEFNPVHDHAGLYSFVIWHKIPYLIEEEYKHFPETKEGWCKAGNFSFIFINQMGRIVTNDLPVDKTWEGKIALFPARLHHVVYPFYSSNDYRVTISGNVAIK
tara:strand:- start:76 stop:657 length:582 start_codon:yes stop_codon:yes gene_type:complete